MSGTSREPGRSVTSRLLAILTAFDGDHRSLSLTELTQRAKLPASTTHRLVGELVEGGLLERTASGFYTVGLKLWELGSASVRAAHLQEVALPYLQDLYEATHENVHLAVLDGTDVLYVVKLSGFQSVSLITRAGRRLPWHSTGAGKAIAAYEREQVVDGLLSHPVARYTRYTLTDPVKLRRELARIRERGYALSNEEHALGTFSVAAPVIGQRRLPIAAVAVTAHSSRAELKKLTPTVRTVTMSVGRALNATPEFGASWQASRTSG